MNGQTSKDRIAEQKAYLEANGTLPVQVNADALFIFIGGCSMADEGHPLSEPGPGYQGVYPDDDEEEGGGGGDIGTSSIEIPHGDGSEDYMDSFG